MPVAVIFWPSLRPDLSCDFNSEIISVKGAVVVVAGRPKFFLRSRGVDSLAQISFPLHVDRSWGGSLENLDARRPSRLT